MSRHHQDRDVIHEGHPHIRRVVEGADSRAQPARFPRALELQADGFIWTTGRNLSAAGFGSLTWNAAPASPPRGELVPAAATVLAITSILSQTDGSAVLTARLTSAIDVAFDGSATFSAVDPRKSRCARRTANPRSRNKGAVPIATIIFEFLYCASA